MADLTGAPVAAPGSHVGSRAEYAARVLEQLAERAQPGERLGTKVSLRPACGVSVGTFNEAVKLAQSRGWIVSRSGPGGGIFAAERSAVVRLGNSVLALDGDAPSVADAVRMRDALDPLLVEDAVWHSSAIDVREMRDRLRDMANARDDGDPVAFVRANWALHRKIAEVSPSVILRSVYLSLLDIVQAHTRGVGGTETSPLPRYIAERYLLHERLVDAIEAREHDAAQRLIREHNNTAKAR
ncbi:FadR/GntR family transcriptional regulator [Amycolatopsis sp. NPDC059021]|uniref:FadR/GntR family transcriptional regulator n=1 Tax=Amycolatopsis sp. NPDC059021 TaxID=3346704 RepID=UPI00366DE621